MLFGAIGVLLRHLSARGPDQDVPLPERFPQPQVVTDEADIEDCAELAAAQNQRLQTWRWADDHHTLVQIPIDRAMQLLVQKGANAYAPLLPPQAGAVIADARRAERDHAAAGGASNTADAAAHDMTLLQRRYHGILLLWR